MNWMNILKGTFGGRERQEDYFCSKTKLMKYPTKEDAENAVILGKKAPAYKCEHCGEFHRKSTLPPDYKEQWRKNIEEQLRRIT